jgi:hypothetical protein
MKFFIASMPNMHLLQLIDQNLSLLSSEIHFSIGLMVLSFSELLNANALTNNTVNHGLFQLILIVSINPQFKRQINGQSYFKLNIIFEYRLSE